MTTWSKVGERTAPLHPDGLRAAKSCQTPGLCIFCEEPLGARRRFLCSAGSCETAYWAAWKRDRLTDPRARASARASGRAFRARRLERACRG